ncbi:MAG: type II toxin-antitoxin system HipA family toxin, partial [Candidatus Berkiella sp.]
SPAYDLNPCPLDIRPRILATAIDIDDATGTIDLAMSVVNYFGLSLKQAKNIVSEVAKAVSCWRKEAKKFGISNRETDRMASAFELSEVH